MLARLRGFKAVPQQGAQHAARNGAQNPMANSFANPVVHLVAKPVANARATRPLIAQRSEPDCGPRIGFQLRLAPGAGSALGGGRSCRFRWACRASRSLSFFQARGAAPAASAPRWFRAAVLPVARVTGLTVGLALGLAVALVDPLRAEPAPRPPDLKILVEKTTMREGTHWLGVYGRVADPDQPGLWRVKIWREWSDRVAITTDSIDCRPGRATRAGVTASKVVVQTLNPGGPINPANRLDHLIWWATCFPEQAGRDPAGLGPLARSLGFDGRQSEHFEVLSVPPLPHP